MMALELPHALARAMGGQPGGPARRAGRAPRQGSGGAGAGGPLGEARPRTRATGRVELRTPLAGVAPAPAVAHCVCATRWI